MLELIWMARYSILQLLGGVIVALACIYAAYLVVKTTKAKPVKYIMLALVVGLILLAGPVAFSPRFEYPAMIETYGPKESPGIPFKNILGFFLSASDLERVGDIAVDPTVPSEPLEPDEDGLVRITIEAKEVIAEIAPGVTINYWTFGGTVPGPFIRVREGDTIELTLKNDPTSLQHHNIDLHAVTGPGGGGVLTNVAPGESATMVFKALNPGLYVYHCAHTNVATHTAHGMYGLIFVEPKEGLPEVDKEFYIMQGEFYTEGRIGKKGLQIFDAQNMMDGDPTYIVFNGRVKGLNGKMEAEVGDKVRFYVGNGGVNMVSSFHLIGEIFDDVYPEAAIGGEPHHNVQTTIVPAGGATIVDFTLDVPGNFILVDHALARLDRGAWGVLTVTGEENPEVFRGEDGHAHDDDDH